MPILTSLYSMPESDQPESHQILLGIDYGDARIGIAVSDALGCLAHPVETVSAEPRKACLQRIAVIFRDRKCRGLVVGLPVREDGVEGTAAGKVRKFADSLKPYLPYDIPVVFQDEYRSTVDAAAQLRSSGKKTKSHRPLIDQAAAVVILQNFLDEKARGQGMDPAFPEGNLHE